MLDDGREVQIADIEVMFKKPMTIRYDGSVHVTEVGHEFVPENARHAQERSVQRLYFDFKLVWLNVDQFEPELFARHLESDFRADYDLRKTPPNVVRAYVDLTYSRVALVTPISIDESNTRFF